MGKLRQLTHFWHGTCPNVHMYENDRNYLLLTCAHMLATQHLRNNLINDWLTGVLIVASM